MFRFYLDAKLYETDVACHTAESLKTHGGMQCIRYQLFKEMPGDQPDRLVGPSETVLLKENGDVPHYYTCPPAVFGCTLVA